MPLIAPVPSSGRLPLSSANRQGTDYVDLKKAGYVEEEYYMLGLAPAIAASGDILFDAPYVTRFLIRKPKDPARFNGTVVIEPFGWFGQRGAGWILTRDYLLRKGYAFVGYTLNINKPAHDPRTEGWDPEPRNLNFDFMRRYDYARYAPLGSYYADKRFRRGEEPEQFPPQAQGIAAQLALLLKSNLRNGPAQGLKVERIYSETWAVDGQIWFDYLDQGRHQRWRMPDGRSLIDAYMNGDVTYGDLGGEKRRVPRKLPNDVPFVTVYSQAEMVQEAGDQRPLPTDTDYPRLRYYEITGMPHLRKADLGTDENEPHPADGDKSNDPRCQTLYDEPIEGPVSAILDAMDRWVRQGKPMPKGERVARQGKAVARDPQTGNIIGGIRPPWIATPSASYLTDYETGCGTVYDTKVPYSSTKLKALYGNYAAYADRFELAKQTAVKEGFLLQEDALRLKPIASPRDFETPSTSKP
ncbi:MAG: alpha/beta hydrolase domain-containing protein [Sphingobium sp.]